MNALTISLHLAETTEDGKQWVHLLPAGVVTGIDGRGPFDCTDREGIVLRSRVASGERKMVLDYNHSADLAAPKGGPSPAAGWIHGLHARQDGIYGLVEWTAAAAQHIAAKEYRYISPVISHSADGKVHSIRRASLVNTPNLDQLTGLFSEQDNSTVNETQLLAELRKLLGLGADADPQAILAAVTTLQTSTHAEATPDPTKFVPIGDYQRVVKELNQVNQGLTKQAAEERVDREIRDRTLFPFMRDWAVSLCMVNPAALDDFVTGVSHPAASALLRPSHAGALPPASLHSSRDDAITTEIAANMGLDPKQFADYRAKTSNQD